MSRIIAQKTESVVIKDVSRSWRIQMFTDLSLIGNYVVEFFREKVRYVDDVPGEPIQNAVPLRVTMAQLAPMTVTLADGTELTGAQVAEAVSLFGDKLEEDSEVEEVPPEE